MKMTDAFEPRWDRVKFVVTPATRGAIDAAIAYEGSMIFYVLPEFKDEFLKSSKFRRMCLADLIINQISYTEINVVKCRHDVLQYFENLQQITVVETVIMEL